ncbi:PstS family phosphate ABC transporter substrate-binding protein [Flavobacterium capsici]|uniref:Substrate-binding domain-containing protein n=1 Tax=Flavobacterium capsici TaxID=3075618 RepID=A0AA96F1X0_9FLAO|nr:MULTISPECIES: substrate-binding domain-containing protein [unclassified Flavobacterium]WNM20054.1 substrate-binding domain-containing protein [Flavobacterium sp. PMR2A8]WNM21443.1 substrate-binding domain-containing protein [Flavobacterium sp. PMTSA4]
MNKKYVVLTVFLLALLIFIACKKSNNDEETIIKGKATLYVDESIFPIVEDQQAVFETQYDAKLTLKAKSETEIINSLLNDSVKIAVIPRKLSAQELKVFSSKKIFPKETIFASDAVVFIANKAINDSLISLLDIIKFMKGENVNGIKGLVFDNPNSSTVRLLSERAGIKVTPQKNIFSFATNLEVVKYVSENQGLIGVVGVDWLYQPPLDMQSFIDKTRIMSVKADEKFGFVYPSQENIGNGKYPLARDLYIINCQGYSGLGMGFASFLGGERGQRIILKSGLVPVRYPSRNIVVRNKILNDNN